MEQIEGSETSAFKPQTPGKYPKENILHKEHGESLCIVILRFTKLCECSVIVGKNLPIVRIETLTAQTGARLCPSKAVIFFFEQNFA